MALPPHRRLIACLETALEHLSLWKGKREGDLLVRRERLEGVWAYLALLFLRGSKSFNARYALGETFHRTLHATSRMLMVTQACSTRLLIEPSEG